MPSWRVRRCRRVQTRVCARELISPAGVRLLHHGDRCSGSSRLVDCPQQTTRVGGVLGTLGKWSAFFVCSCLNGSTISEHLIKKFIFLVPYPRFLLLSVSEMTIPSAECGNIALPEARWNPSASNTKYLPESLGANATSKTCDIPCDALEWKHLPPIQPRHNAQP